MIGFIISICIFISVCFLVFYSSYRKQKGAISFRDSMRLTELPIVSFDDTHGNILNFLLDTGSDCSHINKDLIINNKISYNKLNETSISYGMDNIPRKNKLCNIKLIYNNNTFEDYFQINDLNGIFNTIRQDSGVIVHGILGTSFMNKYGYVIDFKKLVAYNQ